MRIELASVEEFCGEIEAEAKNVFLNIVRTRIDRTPEQEEAVSFEVGFWATAVVKRDDANWLLELGLSCGRDTQRGDDGSELAEAMRRQIQATCDQCGLEMRPGKIELF